MTAIKSLDGYKSHVQVAETQDQTVIHESKSPEKPVNFVFSDGKNLEVIKVGPATIHILEDGRNTDNQFGAVSVTLGPKTPGPTAIWHRMNHTTFHITKGRLRFFTSPTAPATTNGCSRSSNDQNSDIITTHVVKAGDFIVVPNCAIHQFDNPFDEEVVFLNTFSPAHYINAIRKIARETQKAVEKGRFPLRPEEQLEIMRGWATFPPPVN
ncbi:putative cupin domain-containing protein [Golovinomyces cichoracearum]|uniref:Putative cupin domain-containing protein n=1 Tax=Golovinomyces cichoracearum TaxID=62708 RepID=A0A420HD79_9PEZI|nr:putative cupin domain-containing protein [Golovinomyces cichoracearum]